MLKEVWDCHTLSIKNTCLLKANYNYDNNGNRLNNTINSERTNYNYDVNSKLAGFSTENSKDGLVQNEVLNEKWFSTFNPILPINYNSQRIDGSIAQFNQKVSAFNQKIYDQSGMPLGQKISFGQSQYQQYNQYENGIRTKEQFEFIDHQTQQKFERDYIYIGQLPVAQLITKQDQQYFENIEVNRLNTPTKVTRNVIPQWSQNYDVFGKPIANTHNIKTDRFESQPLLRLPGQYEDVYSGLYQNGFREYDPQFGRYTTPDPSGLPDGPNPYLYVNNDPLNKVDIYGLSLSSLNQYMADYLVNQSALLVDTDSFTDESDAPDDEQITSLDLPDSAIGANTFDLIDQLFDEARHCWQPDLQTRQIDYFFQGIIDGSELTYASMRDDYNNPYSLGVESTFNPIEPRFITVANLANSRGCKTTGCVVETYRLNAGKLDETAAKCTKQGDDLCILRVLSAVYATQMRFAQTIDLDPSLTYSQKQKIRLYYEGTSGKIKFSNTDPALDSLAKLIAFSQVNCANKWDAACESKWLQKNQRDARNAAILIGAVFAPAVVAAAPEAITAIGAGASTVGTRVLHCILNIACNTKAAAVLDGFATGGMASGGVAMVGNSTVKYTKEELKSASKILKILGSASKTTGQNVYTVRYLLRESLRSIVEADASKLILKAAGNNSILKSQVAVARASFNGIKTTPWVNIVNNLTGWKALKNSEILAKYGFKPIFQTIENRNDIIKIIDTKEYIRYVKYMYENATPSQQLNPQIENALLVFLQKNNNEISILAGQPALHAEVRAANAALNANPKSKISDLIVATYKLAGQKAGDEFTACSNCSGILQLADIVTGSRK